MYQQIKEIAQAALDLQNKNAMDKALRDIVEMCANVFGGVHGEVVVASHTDEEIRFETPAAGFPYAPVESKSTAKRVKAQKAAK